MKAKTRLYRVVRAGNDDVVLVRAANQEQVLRHLARATFSVTVATADDIYQCGRRGIEIEDATAADELAEALERR